MTVQVAQTTHMSNADAKRVSLKMMGESERRNAQEARVPYISPAVEVARRIRVLRETCGLSRPKFAAVMGNMPMTTLKNYELNYRETGLPIIQYIAAVFGPSVVVWVITGEGRIIEDDVKAAVARFDVSHVVG